ncbi:MAG: methylamine dehydrogenase [Gammaproteobacteria bacterium]|nr:MAG: methylamine dehydrogenase [Gammaproteobacteria bacterium]
MKHFLTLSLAILAAIFVAIPTRVAAIDKDLPPLPIEEMGKVETLPNGYPESWVFVDEVSFFNMLSGKVILLDVAEKTKNARIKGIADKSLIGNFIQAKTRPEFYIMESFHERGTRGPRTDVLAIYDKTTFAITKELVWKDSTRLTALPERYSMALSADEKFLFVANMNPGTSFTVVNLETKTIVETIGTPGCVLTYPTGKNSVTSICSNGGLLTTVVDSNGHKKSQHRIAPFFDTDKTPVFERPVIIDGIAYFPSFEGIMHSFDFTGEVAKYIESWSLISDEERKANWRPSGLVLNDRDEQGLYYGIMQPDGHEGTQTHGGTQVWVFDMKKKQRLKVIDIPNWAVSIAVTRGKEPLIVITNGELNLDIFNASDGSFIQTISDFGNNTPLLVHKAY